MRVRGEWDSMVYAKESETRGHLPGLYNLVSWKGYPEEENTWEPAAAVQHLQKLISTFRKDHLDKATATSLPVNMAPRMARLTVKPTATKQKRGRPANGASKRAKKSCAFGFYLVYGLFSSGAKDLVIT